MKTIDDIKKYAIGKHDLPTDSQRYGNAPYAYHLQAVVDIFNQYKYYIDEKYHEDIEKACWCHDLIEDTNVSVKDISLISNDFVSDIVYRVTNEMGYNRKERNFKTYPKIWSNNFAIFVKLCDRIANTRNSKTYGHKMFDVYKNEYPIFRYALKCNNLYTDMWNELDELNELK